MKKIAHPFLMALIFASQLLPAQTLLLPLLSDSSHYRYIDASTGVELFSSFGYHSYNSDNLPLSDLFVSRFSASLSYYRYDYEYNAAKSLTKSTSLVNNTSPTGPWGNWIKDEYTYDAQERNNYFLGQFGNSTNTWNNYYQETFWFDDVTPADSSSYELWDDVSAAWSNYRRYSNYYYPTSGHLKQHTEDEWDTNTISWNDQLLEKYTYLPDGKLHTQQTISYENSQPSITEKDSIIYRADAKIDSIFRTRIIGSPGNINRFIIKFEYDNTGNLVLKNTVVKAQNGSNWTPSSREQFAPGDGIYSNAFSLENHAIYNTVTHSFDIYGETNRHFLPLGNDQVLFVEVQKQRNDQGILVVQSRDSVWYKLLAVQANSPVSASNADCQFANPFRPVSCIVCNTQDQNSMLNIRIMNIHGQVVAQGRVMPGDAWHPGAYWPAGPYFLTVWQNGQYLGQRRMVVP